MSFSIEAVGEVQKKFIVQALQDERGNIDLEEHIGYDAELAMVFKVFRNILNNKALRLWIG